MSDSELHSQASPAEQPAPAAPRFAAGSTVRWRTGLAWCGLLLIGYAVLVYFDLPMMRWRNALVGERPRGLVDQTLESLRQVGQYLWITVALIVVAAFDGRRVRVIIAVLLSIAISQVISNAGKYTVHRQRPNALVDFQMAALADLERDTSWRGMDISRRGSTTQSFPSGHSSASFAFAIPLAFFYPRLAWLVWLLAVGCAGSRYLDAVHWPSDCFAGAVIGYYSARLSLHLLARRP